MFSRCDVKRLLWMVFYCVVLALVGWVDYATGPRLAFFPFYLSVLVFIALRNHWTTAMLYAVLAAALFLTVDLMTNPGLRVTVFPYWRALGQLISFGLVTFTIPKLVEERQRLTESEELLSRRGAELEGLNGKLVATLEELSAERERTIEELLRQHIDLLREHAVAVAELRGTLQHEPGLLRNGSELQVLVDKLDELLALHSRRPRLSC